MSTSKLENEDPKGCQGGDLAIPGKGNYVNFVYRVNTDRVIGLINPKGRVGKTTTAGNLGTALGRLRKKVLVVDMDPQASLSYYLLGAEVHSLERSVYDTITGKPGLKDVLVKRKDEQGGLGRRSSKSDRPNKENS